MAAREPSGDDVGGQDIFDPGDLILQMQLLLLQASQRKLIGAARSLHRMDRVVKVAVFLAKHFKLHAKNRIMVHLELGIHICWSDSSPVGDAL